MSKDLVKEAVRILQENVYATMSTVGKDGVPRVTPLFLSWDSNFDLYWISPKNSWHSANIRANDRVSFVWFNSQSPKWTGVGVYLLAKAQELEDLEEIQKGIGLEYKKLDEKSPEARDFMGELYRVYRAIPLKRYGTRKS